VRETLTRMVEEALLKSGVKTSAETPLPEILFSVPKNEAYGDYATNVALTLAKVLRQNPMAVAEALAAHLPAGAEGLERVEVVKPGFINFFLKDEAFRSTIPVVLRQEDRYGRSFLGKGVKVQVEFVSANPTGPLHIGHGRGAALGGALVNLLKAVGYEVEAEYYLNDLGTQMETLGRSIQARYRELQGLPAEFPENGYRGEYIREIAARLAAERLSPPATDAREETAFFSRYGQETILKGIREDLEAFGIRFDRWFSEAGLVKEGRVRELLDLLKAKDLVYLHQGALWFKSSLFGDEKDRVVVRANGALTYFASDMAYHRDKFQRGFHRLIDIWGADHHGYVPRLKAALKSLGYQPEALTVLLVQLVTLIRDGKPVAMSTRAGEFITLREVLEEVGRDAARYIFLTRRSDSPLDFDLDLAKKQSNENPVYYVQYAHARACSVMTVAEGLGLSREKADPETLHRLVLPEERRLCKLLTEFPEEVRQGAEKLEPHRLPFYLGELAAQFHHYYNHHRILQEDRELAQARLLLTQAVATVIRNALTLLGVSAPRKMVRDDETQTL
jgi:arginyl-tRNA synthetase